MHKWVWISGWAIQPERFEQAAAQALPGAQHIALPPCADAVEQALELAPTRIGGYSLGSLLLLDAIDRIPPELAPVTLAPFTAFCSTAQMGGLTELRTLEMIEARLKKAPFKALKLFYRLADLINEPADHLPYELDQLIWGLQTLQCKQVSPQAIKEVLSICPTDDALMDYSSSLWNSRTHCHKVDATHDYRRLLQALSTLQ